MGKWRVFIAAVGVGLIAFLVWRRGARAAMNGTASTTPAPVGATTGGILASLTAPPKPDGAGVPIEVPRPYVPTVGPQAGVAMSASQYHDYAIANDFAAPGGPKGGTLSIVPRISNPLAKAIKVVAPKPATSALPPVGQGTVVPAKPSTMAQPSPFAFASLPPPGGSFFTSSAAPRPVAAPVPAVKPPPPVATVTKAATSFATRLRF